MYHLVTCETFWVAIGAIGTVVALLLAVRQIRLSRLTSSADLLLRLENQFDSEEFWNTRKKAAKALKNMPNSKPGEIENVFDFFDTIGILARKGALDKELAWNSFYYWLHGYLKFGKRFLDEQRKKYSGRYNEVVELHKCLTKMGKSKATNDSEWNSFLDEEEGITS